MSRNTLSHTTVSLVVAATLILNGCELLDDDDDGAPAPEASGLRTVGDADAFAREMRVALLAQYSRDGGYGDGLDVAVGAPAAPQAEGTSDAFAPPTEGVVVPDVTMTNVQEAGVDESDRVKSDGRFLYVLDSATSDFVGPTGTPGLPEPAETPGGEPDAVTVDVAAEIAPYYPAPCVKIVGHCPLAEFQ